MIKGASWTNRLTNQDELPQLLFPFREIRIYGKQQYLRFLGFYFLKLNTDVIIVHSAFYQIYISTLTSLYIKSYVLQRQETR